MHQLIDHHDRRIVVVDDSPAFLTVVRSILKEIGLTHVDTFADPVSALEFITANHVDLVMTDLMMRPIDGFAFADRIRHTAAVVNRVVPIMLMTGHAGRQNVLKAVHHGIDEVVVKPLSAAHLFDRLNSVFTQPRVYIKTASGYFGPDRRRRNNPNYTGPERRGQQEAAVFGERELVAMRENAYLAGIKAKAADMPGLSALGFDASFEVTTISPRRRQAAETAKADVPMPEGVPQPRIEIRTQRTPVVVTLRRSPLNRTRSKSDS